MAWRKKTTSWTPSQLKDILNDLEKVDDAKERVIQQMNSNSGTYPMNPFRTGGSVFTSSLSDSFSGSVSVSPSVSPSPPISPDRDAVDTALFASRWRLRIGGTQVTSPKPTRALLYGKRAEF